MDGSDHSETEASPTASPTAMLLPPVPTALAATMTRSFSVNDATVMGPPPAVESSLARSLTSTKPLCDLDKPIPIGCTDTIGGWSLRPAQQNDAFLRATFEAVLEESASLPPEQRLVMYDANEPGVPSEQLGIYRKRLDPRRNTKPKKPGEQTEVCTPFNPSGFHFGKISNPKERLLQLEMGSGAYELLTNKFPLFPKHMLLVCKDLVPQQMRLGHVQAICELMQACSFCAYFNSWCASASVNHFHCHVIDEVPPVALLPLLSGPRVAGARCFYPEGFHGFCYVFEAGPQTAEHIDLIVREMQVDNQPHNLLFTPRHVYVFPKPLVRPSRSFDLYPETVGGPELLGSFTVYGKDDYDKLSAESAAELTRLNTAPLPSRLLKRGHGVGDDAVPMPLTASNDASSTRAVPSSKSTDGHLLLSLLEKPFPTRGHGKSRVASVTTAR